MARPLWPLRSVLLISQIVPLLSLADYHIRILIETSCVTLGYPVQCVEGVELGVGPVVGEVGCCCCCLLCEHRIGGRGKHATNIFK